MRCELPIGICLDCNDPTNTVFACCHRLRHACGVSPASLAGTLGHLACYDLDVVYRDDFIVVHLEMAFCYLEGPDFVAVVVVLEMALQSSESVSRCAWIGRQQFGSWATRGQSQELSSLERPARLDFDSADLDRTR